MKNSKHSALNGGRKKYLNKIPPLKLNLENILKTADGIRELISYDSIISGCGYVTDLKEALIVTRGRGYLRIRKDEIPNLIEELTFLEGDIERRSRD